MTTRYCICQTSDQHWTIVDRQAGPSDKENQSMAPDFVALLDAIHYMFSQGHGEFFIQKT